MTSKKVYIPTSIKQLSDNRLTMLVKKLDKNKLLYNKSLKRAKDYYTKNKFKKLAELEIKKRSENNKLRSYNKHKQSNLKITLWDIQTKTIVTSYSNITDASNDLAIERPMIYKILDGKRKTANKKRYTFTYNESEPIWSLIEEKYKKRIKKN